MKRVLIIAVPLTYVSVCAGYSIAHRYEIRPGDWLQVLLISGLLGVTAFYAWSADRQAKANRDMVEETHQERLDSLRPIIVAGRHETRLKTGIVPVVEEQGVITTGTTFFNAGRGVALNLRFFLKTPSRFRPTENVECGQLTALAAGEWFCVGRAGMFDAIEWRSHDLVAEYEDVFGGKWESGLVLRRNANEKSFTVAESFQRKIDA